MSIAETPVTLSTGSGEYSPAYLDRHLTGDMKTATGIRPSGRPVAACHNATWLPARRTCPGLSGGCVDCYAETLERIRPTVGNAAAWRLAEWDRLKIHQVADLAFQLMARSHSRQLSAGVDRPTFRAFASGDWHSTAMVDGWRLAADRAADLTPTLTGWGYSRSYGSAGRELLARFLDRDGYPPAGWTYYLSSDATMTGRTRNAIGGAYHRLPVAVMAKDGPTGLALLEKIRRGTGTDRRAIVCPVDGNRMPIVVTRRDGSRRGACAHCRACLPTRGVDVAPDIVFPIH